MYTMEQIMSVCLEIPYNGSRGKKSTPLTLLCVEEESNFRNGPRGLGGLLYVSESGLGVPGSCGRTTRGYGVRGGERLCVDYKVDVPHRVSGTSGLQKGCDPGEGP